MYTSRYKTVLEGLMPYGVPYIWGSASKGKEYRNKHDIDIGLITNFKSKDFLKEKCVNIATEYMNDRVADGLILPLHFIIVGDFSGEFIFVKIFNIVHMVQFIPKHWRYITWAKVVIKKWKKSLLKKS